MTLPLARQGILGGALLGVGRALGEFGATLIVAGNIPGRTQTLPLALYTAVASGDERGAWTLAGIASLLALACLLTAELFVPRRGRGAARVAGRAAPRRS